MNLVYNDKKISVTVTNNKNIMRYRFQRLYYAIIINNCNRYSSIASKQRVDVIMTDDTLNILGFKLAMHENTVFEVKGATKTVILPLNTFSDLKLNMEFKIMR